MKRVSIFGATGSIGQNTVDLIRRDRTGFEVVALTGGRNVDLLAKSAIKLGAKPTVPALLSLTRALRAVKTKFILYQPGENDGMQITQIKVCIRLAQMALSS